MTLTHVAKASLAVLLVSVVLTSGTVLSRSGGNAVKAQGSDSETTLPVVSEPKVDATDAPFSGALAETDLNNLDNTALTVLSDQSVSATDDEPANSKSLHEKRKVFEKARNDALRALIEALKDNVPQVRHAAAKALAGVGRGSKEAVLALVAVLERTDDEKLRFLAVSSLSRIGHGSDDAVRALSKVVKSEEDAKLRRASIKSLGEIGTGSEVALRSITAALKDTDAQVRVDAAEVLGKMATRRSGLPSDASGGRSVGGDD